MTDAEYDVIDELYFFISFEDLLENVSVDEKVLVQILMQMQKKGWVRCFLNSAGEEPSESDLDLENHYKSYHYLATKEGLKAHNSV